MKGLFIVIEGLNGAGKSTQVKMLTERMGWERPDSVIRTSEPWTSHYGMLLRTMLTSGEPLPPAEEMALLFAADRLAHCKQFIGPALERGQTVICDRYYHSSIAYQGPWVGHEEGGVTKGDGCSWVASLNLWAMCPDLTIVLGVSPEKAAERMKGRSALDALDADIARAQTSALVYYRHLPRFLRGDKIIVADASGSEETTHEIIFGLVEDHIRGEEQEL